MTTFTTHWTFQVHNDDEVKALFKQVQGEVPGSPIFIMKVASQVRAFSFLVQMKNEDLKQLLNTICFAT